MLKGLPQNKEAEEAAQEEGELGAH